MTYSTQRRSASDDALTFTRKRASMIGATGWRWIEESQQFAATTVDPPRELTIRWDDGDRGWFLSVVAPGRPATMGAPAVEQRGYVAPLPLLAALTLVPREHHARLVEQVRRERGIAEGEVWSALSEAASRTPRPWPEAAGVKRAVAGAAVAVDDLERLALDMAAADSWED